MNQEHELPEARKKITADMYKIGTVNLDEDVVKQYTKLANEKGVSCDKFISDILKIYIAEYRKKAGEQ